MASVLRIAGTLLALLMMGNCTYGQKFYPNVQVQWWICGFVVGVAMIIACEYIDPGRIGK